MNTMLFINLDLNKQAQALKVISFEDNKLISLTNLFQQYINNTGLYLNKQLDFYHHILVKNTQMYIRLEHLVN